MARPLKILLIALSVPVLLFVVAAIALPLLFDPNDYRGKIAETVKKETGRDFAVGDIRLAVFPWLRVELKDVKLGNAQGYAPEQMLTVQRAVVGAKLLPLLRDKRIEASTITLEGLTAQLTVNAEGGNNWQDLVKPDAEDPEKPEPPLAERLEALDIGGIALSDLKLVYDDQRAGKRYQLEEAHLKTGRLHAGKPFAVEGRFKAQLPEANAALNFSSKVQLHAKTGDVTLQDIALQLDGNQPGASPLAVLARLKVESLNYEAATQKVSTGPLTVELEKLLSGPADKPTLTAQGTFSSSVALQLGAGDVALGASLLELKAEQTGAEPVSINAKVQGDRFSYLAADQKLSVGTLLLTLNQLATGTKDKPGLNASGSLSAGLVFDVADGRAVLSSPQLKLEARRAGESPLQARLSAKGDAATFATKSQTFKTTPLTLLVDNLVMGASDKPLLTAKGRVLAALASNLTEQRHQLDDMHAELQLSGSALPGGQAQAIKLSASVLAELAEQRARISDLSFAGLGLNVTAKQWLLTQISSAAPAMAGDLAVAPFAPRALMKLLDIAPPVTADNNTLKAASFSGQIKASAQSAAASGMTLKLDDTTLRGDVHVRDFKTLAVTFALKADQLNADRYLPPAAPATKAAASKTAPPSTQERAALNATELPVKLLESLNAKGTLEVGALRVKNLRLADVQLKVDGAAGATQRQQLSAALYGGNANINLAVAPGAKHTLKLGLAGVNAGPLLKDLMDTDKLSGKGSLTLDVSTAGRTVGEVRRALNGTMAFSLADGAVKGFNLGKVMRDGQALLQAQTAAASDSASTDFAELKGSGVFTNGVLKSDQLSAKSPLIRLEGAGQVDLVRDTIDYLAKPTLVNTAGGQGGKELAGLSGITVPVRITGDLYAPKAKLDWQAAIKQQAVTELREKLGVSEETVREHREELRGKAKEELSKGLLKLFGGKSAPAPAPETAPPAEPAPSP